MRAVAYMNKLRGWVHHALERSPTPPPLVEDPAEALRQSRKGRRVAFACPVARCTHFVGFGLDPRGWHPFVATLEAYRTGVATTYETSLLRAYYAAWKPTSAADAYAGFDAGPAGLRALPPYAFYLVPWASGTPETVAADTSYWVAQENAEHGCPDLTLSEHGLGYFGPVAPAKGELEFRRLASIFERLRVEGYDRRHGDVNVRMLRRGSDLRFVIDGGGYHRAAALAAAGYATMPATLREPVVIAPENAADWPQVRSGLWTKEKALRYFDHLFDFDAKAWAEQRGLLIEQLYDPPSVR